MAILINQGLPLARRGGEEFKYAEYGLPVLELTGDTSAMTKENPVTLAYKYKDMAGTCEVKWQGSSSIHYPKKNYTIKFDQEFEAKEGWGAQKKYCLKANFIDHSHARNVVSAKLWGDVVKSREEVATEIANLPNNGAIDGFPVCVTLNGKYHGLYTWNIPKDEWMFGMGLGDRECILCAQGYSPATRFSGEALCDGSDYEIEYVTDENDTAWVAESLNRLIHACLSSDGSDIDTLISQYVDIDSAIDNLIFTSLISGHDCYDKNHLLVTFDGVKWFFSPYDLDSTFGNDWHGKSYKNPLTCQPMPKWAAVNNGLYRLLMQYKTDKVKARYEELRKGVLSEANLILEFENFMAGIPSAVYDEDPKVWPTIPGTKTNGIAQIATNYMLRAPAADKEVEAFTPVVHSYTNLVPTLSEGTSDAVFNGIGYKNDWVIDPNPGRVTFEYVPVPAAGQTVTLYGETVCTGCIPYAISSSTGTYPSIYIKGPNLDMERLGTRTEAGGHLFAIAYCNNDKVLKWITGIVDETVWTMTNMGDNYIKLDVNAGTVVNCMGGVTRYIRFQLPGHGEGLIISIGQPIE